MSNMSYCRFRNTLSDLRDCRENLEGKIDDRDEARARLELLRECLNILDIIGVGDIDTAEERIAEFVEMEQEEDEDEGEMD